MNPAYAVLCKELSDGIRDRRSVMSAMMFPVLAPVLVFLMINTVINVHGEVEESFIPVKGAQNAPALIQWLKEHNVKMEDFTGDPQQAVTSKRRDFVLVIPDTYAKDLAALKPAVVELVNDGARNDTRPAVNRVRMLISQYSNEIASLRLIARGVSPRVMHVVDIQNIEIASNQQLTAAALNFIPLYIILAGFISGMGLAVDATAGERERKSLEPLLINPIRHHEIVIGKWIASGLFASFGTITTLLLCLFGMEYVPLQEMGLSFRMTAGQTLGMIAATLPLAFLATSMQLLLGIFAKSFKDAQSYIGLLTFLPMFPFLLGIFYPVAPRDWMFSIPILSQHLMLVDVMGGKILPVSAFVLAGMATLILGLGLTMLTARLLSREDILAG